MSALAARPDTTAGIGDLFGEVNAARSIPVISLWQPWASLIFAGRKSHETRSFRPPRRYVGGMIGIHATAKFPPLRFISGQLHELCMDEFGCSYNETLPQGVVLGTATLSTAVRTEDKRLLDDDDFAAGDWTPGRFAWPLSDVVPFASPVPAKGKQGWWSIALAELP